MEKKIPKIIDPFQWNKFNSLPKMVKLLPNIVKNYQKKKYDKLRVNLLTDLDNRYQKWLNHYQF